MLKQLTRINNRAPHVRRRAVVVAQSFGGLFEMPCDNFRERIEVDGRGAVPAVGEGFFVGGFDVGGGFVIFAEHLHVHFRIFVADRRVATLEIIAPQRSS